MDPSSLSPESQALHREMTESLRRALGERDPLRAIEALCVEWESAHAHRDEERKRLEGAISRAKAHYRCKEAERLEQQLSAL